MVLKKQDSATTLGRGLLMLWEPKVNKAKTKQAKPACQRTETGCFSMENVWCGQRSEEPTESSVCKFFIEEIDVFSCEGWIVGQENSNLSSLQKAFQILILSCVPWIPFVFREK
ncbi:uncharacterized protein J5M81_014139 [Pluvialis apricaria]